MHIALKAPAVFGADLDPLEILSVCRDLGVQTIELAASSVEALLGKPTVPAWWIEMPESGFETGALPLEEEILQDEIDLARETFGTRVREWRASVSLAALEGVRDKYRGAGVTIATLNWTDLSTLSDVEVDYAFNIGKTLGANALTMPLVTGVPRRLAPFADRHAMRIAFEGSVTTRPSDFIDALMRSRRIALSLDLNLWIIGGHGSPLPFLRQNADQIIQVYIDAADVIDGPAAETVREVVREIRTNGWPMQVTIGLGRDARHNSERIPVIALAIDHCLNGLRLST